MFNLDKVDRICSQHLIVFYFFGLLHSYFDLHFSTEVICWKCGLSFQSALLKISMPKCKIISTLGQIGTLCIKQKKQGGPAASYSWRWWPSVPLFEQSGRQKIGENVLTCLQNDTITFEWQISTFYHNFVIFFWKSVVKWTFIMTCKVLAQPRKFWFDLIQHGWNRNIFGSDIHGFIQHT